MQREIKPEIGKFYKNKKTKSIREVRRLTLNGHYAVMYGGSESPIEDFGSRWDLATKQEVKAYKIEKINEKIYQLQKEKLALQ